MFSSVSRTIPKTVLTTSFVATRAMTIEVVSFNDFYIRVNGVQATNYQSIAVSTGDTVTAVFTTPDDFLWYKFLYYKIDGVPQSFAVVNKSEYTSRVKAADAIKRWYLYTSDPHRFTFRSSAGGFDTVEFGTSVANLYGDYHIILEPNTNSVGFFSPINHFISRVVLPAPPIDYAINPLRDTLLVLARSGEVYEIFLNSRAEGLAPFLSLRNYSEFTGDLSYLTRLPGEDLITFLRRLRNKLAIPPATCITTVSKFLIAGGNGTIWVVDLSLGFVLVNTFAIDEYILELVPLPDNSGVLAVTQSQKIYTITLSGQIQEIYRGASLWQPALFNGKIYISECNIEGDNSPTSFTNEGRLLVYNPTTGQFEQPIGIPEFCPSYITVGSGKMYVCGHDTERVLEFDSQLQYNTIFFSDKVTWVSESQGSLIASHYLSTYKILIAPDLFRIIEVDFRPRTGPVSYIGTNIETVKLLGSTEVNAYTPNDTWIWSNGQRTESNKPRGVTLFEGDYISLSYAARVAGTSRTNCVIGDTAYDYDTTAVAQTYYARHIDLPVQTVGDFGIHSRTITLPRFFTPCLMSLEYGTLLVNDAFYFGDRLVYPEDTVEIRILAGKTAQEINSVLPIFTIGARQFVIPVAKFPQIPTQTFVDDNLAPNTSLTKTVTITTLSDFIIPGYYDLIIKKNNLNITGNYYQQFGLNDTLVIEFNSSRKRYDERDVYILGTPNYRFNAKNLVENKIGYLNFGNITSPFPRLFNLQATQQTVNLGASYPIASYYDSSPYQFITSNLAITGLAANTTGNLSHNGVDTFFVHNGNVIIGTNEVSVKLGDNIALCRNINNFFEQTITVTQLLPDPEDDFFVDIEVGRWGVINQTIVQPPDIYYQSFSVNEKPVSVRAKHPTIFSDKNSLELAKIYYFKAEPFKITKNKDTYTLDNFVIERFEPEPRKIFSAIESFTRVNVLNTTSLTTQLQQSYGLLAEKFNLIAIGTKLILANDLTVQPLAGNTILLSASTSDLDVKNYYIDTLVKEFSPQSLVTGSYSIVEKDRSKNRKITSAIETFNESQSFTVDSAPVKFNEFEILQQAQPSARHLIFRPTINLSSKADHEVSNVHNLTAPQFKEFSFNESGAFVDSYPARQEIRKPIVVRSVNANIIEWAEKTNEIMAGAKSTINIVYRKVNEAVIYFNSDKQTVACAIEKYEYNYGLYEFLLPVAAGYNLMQQTSYLWKAYVGDTKQDYSHQPKHAGLNYGTSSEIEYDIEQFGDYAVDSSRAIPTGSEYAFNEQYYEVKGNEYSTSYQQFIAESRKNSFAASKQFYEVRELNYSSSQQNYDLTTRNFASYEQNHQLTTRNYTATQQSYEVRLSNLADEVITFYGKIELADPIRLPASYNRLEKLTFVENNMSARHLDSYNYMSNTSSSVKLELADKLRSVSAADPGPSLKHLIKMDYRYELRGLGSKNSAQYENELRPREIVNQGQYESQRALEIPVTMNYTHQILGNGARYRIDFTALSTDVGDLISMTFGQTEYVNTATSIGKFDNVRLNAPSPVGRTLNRMQQGREFLVYPHKWYTEIQRTGFADQNKFEIVDYVPFTALLPLPREAGRQMIGMVVSGSVVVTRDKDKLILALPPKLENENISFEAAAPVELDRHLVWDNEIEVIYGAFATQEDAIEAAKIYTSFRPYLILNTHLWTYRVLLDTNLVCPLPLGRYPIAWLIRGG